MLDDDFGSCCVWDDIAKRIVLAHKNTIDVMHGWSGGFNGSVPEFQSVCVAIPVEA